MSENRKSNFPSPDLSKLQAVSVDFKTTIFIPFGADPVKAKKRYLEMANNKFVKRG